MDFQYITDRKLLRFADEVKIQFGFLELQGFRCVSSEVTLVRFESLDIGICVYHEKLSHEIGSTVESLMGPDTYSFSEILRLVHRERMEEYRDYATNTVEGVAEGVRQLAELFRKSVDIHILKDREFFPNLKQQRNEWARNHALETQLVQARKKSDVAWKKGDFGEVVQILISLREHLNPSDLKKLEYAIKHSNA
jgi:hypothetical protein